MRAFLISVLLLSSAGSPAFVEVDFVAGPQDRGTPWVEFRPAHVPAKDFAGVDFVPDPHILDREPRMIGVELPPLLHAVDAIRAKTKVRERLDIGERTQGRAIERVDREIPGAKLVDA